MNSLSPHTWNIPIHQTKPISRTTRFLFLLPCLFSFVVRARIRPLASLPHGDGDNCYCQLLVKDGDEYRTRHMNTTRTMMQRGIWLKPNPPSGDCHQCPYRVGGSSSSELLCRVTRAFFTAGTTSSFTGTQTLLELAVAAAGVRSGHLGRIKTRATPTPAITSAGVFGARLNCGSCLPAVAVRVTCSTACAHVSSQLRPTRDYGP